MFLRSVRAAATLRNTALTGIRHPTTPLIRFPTTPSSYLRLSPRAYATSNTPKDTSSPGYGEPPIIKPEVGEATTAKSGSSTSVPPASPFSENDPILPTDATATPLSQMEDAAARAAGEKPSTESQVEAGAGSGGAEPPIDNEDLRSRILPGHGRGADGLPKSAYISSTDRRRDRLAKLMFAGFFAGAIGGALYFGRDWDEVEYPLYSDKIPNGYSPDLIWKRMNARIGSVVEYYYEPVFEKLLPDPLPDPDFQRPYTLVLGLEDLLVHTSWDRVHGWRTAKRPGLDYFLLYLSMYYELVVFSSQPSYLLQPIFEKLNAYPGYFSHGLAREATRYMDGVHVKDLSHLNRDLSKVILVDTDAQVAKLQPENAIIIPPWNGDPKDRTLLNLLSVLEFLAAMQVKDVRPVLESYHQAGTDVPTEFARLENEQRRAHLEQLAEQRAKRKSGGASVLGSLLGGGSVMTKAQKEREEKLFIDTVRERGQENYKELLKMVEAQKGKWEEEERLKRAELEGTKTSLSKILSEGIPSAPKQ